MAMKRRGDWFTSSTGAQLWPLDLRSEDVEIEDIAHSLSNLCRFNGRCKRFYSVAQHSVLVAEQLAPEFQLTGLLHDATEAYLGDMVRPLKRFMPAYRKAEAAVWLAVRCKFGLPFHLPAEVKEADSRLLQTERRDLLVAPFAYEWYLDRLGVKPYPFTIKPWGPDRARREFLAKFVALQKTPPGTAPLPYRRSLRRGERASVNLEVKP